MRYLQYLSFFLFYFGLRLCPAFLLSSQIGLSTYRMMPSIGSIAKLCITQNHVHLGELHCKDPIVLKFQSNLAIHQSLYANSANWSAHKLPSWQSFWLNNFGVLEAVGSQGLIERWNTFATWIFAMSMSIFSAWIGYPIRVVKQSLFVLFWKCWAFQSLWAY